MAKEVQRHAPTEVRFHGLIITFFIIWEAFLAAIEKEKSVTRKVIEVGVHGLGQCLQAASAGLKMHWIEASPISYEKIVDVFAAEKQKGNNAAEIVM